MRRVALTLLLLGSALWLAAQPNPAKSSKTKSSSKVLPVTTSSPQAQDLFEKAMVDYENLQLDRATQGWRNAAKLDPDFALAHAWTAFASTDPAEVEAERERAKVLAPRVTSGEQLMIGWIVNVQENNFVAGIADMNDMLAMYPKDKRLLFLAGNWLMGEQEESQARKLFSRALAIDKNYPAALNDMAYAYAREANFPPAFDAMERYIKLLPSEPNPEDSYAEILRMSGNYDGALEHYRAALKIDSNFYSSQLGLADTYALVGDEVRARAEYEKAIQQDGNEANRLGYAIQSAMTWVRENKFNEADRTFNAVVDKAHLGSLHVIEARAHRLMAMYQTDDKAALQHLDLAESAIGHHKNAVQSDREEERARILRLRTVRAIHGGNQQAAMQALHQLEAMANGSHNTVIQQSYHAALGALLMAQEKYADAIANLQEDNNDPFSLELLSRAYGESGATEDVHRAESKLRSINTPTMEQALVVIPARGRRPLN
jgi:tetratricopeptide (TPR) repeat protein